jgi:hypothetical protein
MYALKRHMIPHTMCFPRVKTVSLLHCEPETIPLLLTPSVFPSLKEIHYLSGHPGCDDIHRRVSPNVSWIFPNHDSPFYNTMVETGHGIKSDTLISSYVSKELKDDFELYIPQYTLVKGEEYRSKLVKYMNSDTCAFGMLDSAYRLWKPKTQSVVDHPIGLYMKKQTEHAFLKCIL